jgi:subtilisin-like proprotein convertase family protein
MYSSSPALAIPDVGCPALTSDTIIVPFGAPNVQKVTVRVNITHTYDGDLQFQLTHGATTVNLATNIGSGGDNFVDTVFDDDAFLPIASGAAPFTGFYIPEESLSAFTGATAVGNWVLELCDAYGGDTGTLNSWDICFGPAAVTPTPVPTWTPYTGPVPATGPVGIGILAFALSALLGISTLRKR